MASFTVDSYPTSNHDLTYGIGLGMPGVGQGFAGANGVLDRVRWYIQRNGSPTGNCTAKIYTHSGTFGTNGAPGSLLATSSNVDVAALSTSLTVVDFEFTGANRIALAAGTNYFVTFEFGGSGGTIEVSVDITAPAHGGNVATFNGTVWAPNATQDMIFYVLAGRANQARTLLGVG